MHGEDSQYKVLVINLANKRELRKRKRSTGLRYITAMYLAFLAAVLPLHPQYGSSDHDVELIAAREECRLMLADVGDLLGQVALYIDRRCHGGHGGRGGRGGPGGGGGHGGDDAAPQQHGHSHGGQPCGGHGGH